MQILKAGFLYFALVFAAGFVLGVFRELWVVPRFGPMMAELLEMPVMLVVVVLAARWTVRQCGVSPAPVRRFGMGLAALVLLVFVEITVVLSMRRLSFGEYLKGRDPVSGTLYLVMLGVFAIMPRLISRQGKNETEEGTNS